MATREGMVLVVQPKTNGLSISLLEGSLLSSAELLLHKDEASSMKTEDCRSSLDLGLVSQNLEMRHVASLKSYIDQIRSTYTCDPLECPSLRERLDKHRLMHHTSDQNQTDVILDKNRSTLTIDPPTNDQSTGSGFEIRKKSVTVNSKTKPLDEFSRLYGEKAQLVKDAYIDEDRAQTDKNKYSRRMSRVNQDIRNKYNEDKEKRTSIVNEGISIGDKIYKTGDSGKVSVVLGGNISTSINDDNEDFFDKNRSMNNRRPSMINGEVRNKFNENRYSEDTPSTYELGVHDDANTRISMINGEYTRTPRNSIVDDKSTEKRQVASRNYSVDASPARKSKFDDEINNINARISTINNEYTRTPRNSPLDGNNNEKRQVVNRNNTDNSSLARKSKVDDEFNNMKARISMINNEYTRTPRNSPIDGNNNEKRQVVSRNNSDNASSARKSKVDDEINNMKARINMINNEYSRTPRNSPVDENNNEKHQKAIRNNSDNRSPARKSEVDDRFSNINARISMINNEYTRTPRNSILDDSSNGKRQIASRQNSNDTSPTRKPKNNDGFNNFDAQLNTINNEYARTPRNSMLDGNSNSNFNQQIGSIQNNDSTPTQKSKTNDGFNNLHARISTINNEYTRTPRNSMLGGNSNSNLKQQIASRHEYTRTPRNSMLGGNSNSNLKQQIASRHTSDTTSPARKSKADDEFKRNLSLRLSKVKVDASNDGRNNQWFSRATDGNYNERTSNVNTDFKSSISNTRNESKIYKKYASNRSGERVSRVSYADKTFPGELNNGYNYKKGERVSKTFASKAMSSTNGFLDDNNIDYDNKKGERVSKQYRGNNSTETMPDLNGYENQDSLTIDELKKKISNGVINIPMTEFGNIEIEKNDEIISMGEGAGNAAYEFDNKRTGQGVANMTGVCNMGKSISRKYPKADFHRQADEAQTKLTFSNLGDFQLSMNPNNIEKYTVNDDGSNDYNKTYLKTDTLDISPRIYCYDKKCELNGIRHTTTNKGCTHSKCSNLLAKTVTTDNLPKHFNTYYSDIRLEVKDWMEKIMVYLDPGCQASKDRDKAVDDLIDKLLHLHGEAHADDYDDLIKWVAKDMLVKLPVWYPGRNNDVDDFVENHIFGLLRVVKKINDKWDHRNYEDTCCLRKKSLGQGSKSDHGFKRTLISDKICAKYNEGINKKKEVCHPFCKSERYLLEYEIMDWINQNKIVTPDGSSVSKRDIVNIVLEKTAPLLNKAYSPTNKIILKAKIVQILDSLPICVNCTKKQRLQMVKYVDELANKLLSVQIRIEEGTKKFQKSKTRSSKPVPNFKEINGSRKESNQNIVNDERERLEQALIEDIRKCIGKTNGDQNDIEERILEVLINNIGEIRINNLDYATVEILEVLHVSNQLNLTDSMTMVDCILKSCKESIQNHLENSGNVQTVLNKPRQSEVVIYKSETRFSSSTNMVEKCYTDKVAKTIKGWMSSNFARFVIAKYYNTDFITYLASDIVQQVKLEQLVPRPRIDKQKWWIYYIFRLLNKNIYENIKEAEPEVKELVDKLAMIRVPNLTNNKDCAFNVFTASTETPSKNQSKASSSKKDDNKESPKVNKSSSKANKDQKAGKAGPSKENSSRVDHDAYLHKYIEKYLEHNYDVSEPMARRAYFHVLKSELEKVPEPTRKEVYEKLLESSLKSFSTDSFALELDYIKDISDWLNDLPVDSSFNTTANKDRIEFVDDLAHSLIGENESVQQSIINKHIDKLPMPEEYKNNVPMMVDMLSKRISERRRAAAFSDSTCLKCCTPQQDFDEFLEESIRVNGPELIKDERKLEAWTKRVADQVKKNAAQDEPSKFTKANVYGEMAKSSPNSIEPLKKFSFELAYAQVISEWLKNLPLEDASTNVSIRMIGDLAEKICERDAKKGKDKNADNDLRQYVSNWIKELPVDKHQEIDIPTAVQQLMLRINDTQFKKSNKRDSTAQTEPSKAAKTKKEKPDKKARKGSKSSGNDDECCIYKTHCVSEPEDLIVDAIEKWASNLPINGNESKVAAAKNIITRKLYQKVSELNTNPRTQKDNLNYSNHLADEIDTQLANVPKDTLVAGDKVKMRDSLIAEIMAAKRIIEKSFPTDTYRQKLEDSAVTKLPADALGIDLYKRRLADLFILENFDPTADVAKQAYLQKIKDEIEAYGNFLQRATGLNRDKMFNVAYATLFNIPVPTEKILDEEVEEVKSKYEIKQWFDILPKRDPSYIEELEKRDELLIMLNNNLHKIQKKEPNDSENMHSEVINWLHKTGLFTGQENRFNDYANQLISSLKSGKDARKCYRVVPKEADKSVVDKSITKIQEKDKPMIQKEGKQPKNKSKEPVAATTLQPSERRRSSDMVPQLVESWVKEIPLVTSTPQDQQNIKSIKDNLATSIISKVNNLNSDPTTSHNDKLYDSILSEDVDKALSSLPTEASFEQRKEGKKHQLMQALHALKPHFIRENDRFKYRTNLKDVTSRNMEESANTNPDKSVLLDILKDKIVDNFILYKYNNEDDNAQQIPKNNIKNAMSEHLNKVLEIADVSRLPIEHREQMRTNHIISEFNKVPAPDDGALGDEVQEIKLKEQLENNFPDLTCPKDGKRALKATAKNNLAKELFELEKQGHTPDKELEMKNEITKEFRKLGKEISPEKIDAFIQKLRENEHERKALPYRKAPTTVSYSTANNSVASKYSKTNNTSNLAPDPCNEINGQMYIPTPYASAPQPYSTPYNVSIQQPHYAQRNSDANNPHSFAVMSQNVSHGPDLYNREQSLAMSPGTPLKHDPTHHDDMSYVNTPVMVNPEYEMLLPNTHFRNPPSYGMSYNPAKQTSYLPVKSQSLGPNQRFNDRSAQRHSPHSAYHPQGQSLVFQSPSGCVLSNNSYPQSMPTIAGNLGSVYPNQNDTRQSFPGQQQYGPVHNAPPINYVSDGAVPWSQASISPQWEQYAVQAQIHRPNQTAYSNNQSNFQGQNSPPIHKDTEHSPAHVAANQVRNVYAQNYEQNRIEHEANETLGKVQNETGTEPLVPGEVYDAQNNNDDCSCQKRPHCPMCLQYCGSDDYIPFCLAVQRMCNVMPYDMF